MTEKTFPPYCPQDSAKIVFTGPGLQDGITLLAIAPLKSLFIIEPGIEEQLADLRSRGLRAAALSALK